MRPRRRTFAHTIAALCLGPLMAESVEVTARQFSRINALFSQMVAILDIRPVPRLFLEGSPSPQAFTVGLGRKPMLPSAPDWLEN